MSFNLIAILTLSSPAHVPALLDTLYQYGQFFLRSEPGMLRYVIHQRLNADSGKTEVVVIER
jgi:hypothetical protein